MIIVKCRVAHNPPETHGDCVRTAFASLLNIADPTDVPHFFHDGCDGEIAHKRINQWLASKSLTLFYIWFDGALPLSTVLETMKNTNPTVNYILWGETSTSPHVVVCKSDKIVNDPGWYTSELVGPSGELWCITVVVPLLLTVDE